MSTGRPPSPPPLPSPHAGLKSDRTALDELSSMAGELQASVCPLRWSGTPRCLLLAVGGGMLSVPVSPGGMGMRPWVQRRVRPVLALTTGLSVGEGVILQAIGFSSAIPLAPQISAPAAFAVFHDLRWVWTFADSFWTTVWMLVALLVFRTVTNALIIRLAWPAGLSPPGYPTLLRRSALFTALAVIALSPWATLTFMAAATSFSPLMLAAIIGSVLALLLLPPGIITGQWWRRLLPVRTMGWILLSWVELMIVSLIITFAPNWMTILPAAAGGLFNGWVWRRIVACALRAGAPRWTIPGLPFVAVAASDGLLMLAGFALAGAFGERTSSPIPSVHVPTPSNTPPVLYLAGWDSSYDGGGLQPLPGGFQVVRYSYRGLDPDGRPLPYSHLDTHQSLQVSARRLAEQIKVLHRETGQPVDIVAVSEGTMVSRTYFASAADPPVDTFVQLSALIRPARVYYPVAGDDYGYVAGWAGRGILDLLRLQAPKMDLTVEMPFVRSMVTDAPLYRDQTLCPIPGIHMFLYFPLEDGLTVYRGPLARIPWTTLPALHGTLLNDAQVQREVADVLLGHPHPHTGWEDAFEAIRGAAGAWQSPALPLRARPAWNAQPNSDPAFGHWGCTSVPTGK